MSTLADRLLARSIQQGSCRLWTGNKYHDGYGKMSWQGKTDRAHRLAWRAWRGPIPQGLNVLHTCDTPLCIEPTHLFLGSHADNVADKMRKGRHPRNVTFGHRILTEAQARAVFKARGRQVDIAAKYGVTQAAVSKIKRKATWKHIH
jgi:hypothetical protein